MAKIVLENVRKNYGASEDAVKGVSFTCEDGEFMVMLGPSGCGKTTTLRMITGLETITGGTIRIGDRVINDLSPRERNVAMAFETYALYPPLTVYENIAFPLQVMKLPKTEVHSRVLRVAESLSITDILDVVQEHLAGGQKQRVSLARALVRDPSVFLMDEPLSHVDADMRHRARTEIKHMQSNTGSTVIYVTHDQVEAVALADRVVVMDMGEIMQIGPPMDLYYKPTNLFVAGFIGEPPINIVECQLSTADDFIRLAWPGSRETALQFPINGANSDVAAGLFPYNGKQVAVGVRPQRLKLTAGQNESAGDALSGRLLIHEFLGKEGIAQVNVEGTILECFTSPEIPFDVGDTVWLSASFDDLHFFDPSSTKRIE